MRIRLLLSKITPICEAKAKDNNQAKKASTCVRGGGADRRRRGCKACSNTKDKFNQKSVDNDIE